MTAQATVLVVDDSQFMRTVLKNELTDRGYNVSTARNGQEAVSHVASNSPDVITMDVNMPKMNGLEATEAIMQDYPTPIIMLSAHTDADAEATLDALELGAVDFLTKPGGQEVSLNVEELTDMLTNLIETAQMVDVEKISPDTDVPTDTISGVDAATTSSADTDTDTDTDSTGVQQPPRPTLPDPDAEVDTETASLSDDRPREAISESPVVFLGASTGGPKVLERIMAGLPAELGARVVIIQHMPENFTSRLGERLDAVSEYDVREATNGATIGPGEAIIARGGHHLKLTKDTNNRLHFSLSKDREMHGVRPAIDVTLESAVDVLQSEAVAVLLTGMGSDGSKGIKAIKEAGGHTIAQDEDTSAIYGIPKKAVQSGYVDSVLPDTKIVTGILDSLTEPKHVGEH